MNRIRSAWPRLRAFDDAGIIEHVLRQSDDVVEKQIDSDVEDEP